MKLIIKVAKNVKAPAKNQLVVAACKTYVIAIFVYIKAVGGRFQGRAQQRIHYDEGKINVCLCISEFLNGTPPLLTKAIPRAKTASQYGSQSMRPMFRTGTFASKMPVAGKLTSP